jgi:hypothetical protein
MVSQLSPPQSFSHVGMMLQDHSKIGTVTFSADWLQEYPNSPFAGEITDGFQEVALRFGFPGGVHELTTDEALLTGFTYDTENLGTTFTVTDWSLPTRCERSTSAVGPVVWKPSVIEELAVRPRLAEAVEIYRSLQGHYRFFAYSDATVALDEDKRSPTGLDNEEISDSPGIMCASAIWLSLTQAGFELEGPDLEPEDDVTSLFVDEEQAPDGLYPYTPEERVAAAQAFYRGLFNDVRIDLEGWWGELLTSAATDIATQITNCFVRDDCAPSAKDSLFPAFGSREVLAAWAGWGRTVSPEQVLNWDGPGAAGPYGHLEKLVFRPTTFVRQMVWRRTEAGSGSLTGTVMLDGSPVEAGVPVYVEDANGNASLASTDASGGFFFAGLAPGPALVRVELSRPGESGGPSTYLQDSEVVDILDQMTAFVALELEALPAFGQVRVSTEIHLVLKDDEVGRRHDHYLRENISAFCDLDVNPETGTMETCTLYSTDGLACVGGEVTTMFHINARITESTSDPVPTPLAAELTLTGDLWEYQHRKADCENPEDHADCDSMTWTVRLANPEPTCVEMRLKNDETFGGDYADFTVRTRIHDPNELIDWTNQPACP